MRTYHLTGTRVPIQVLGPHNNLQVIGLSPGTSINLDPDHVAWLDGKPLPCGLLECTREGVRKLLLTLHDEEGREG